MPSRKAFLSSPVKIRSAIVKNTPLGGMPNPDWANMASNRVRVRVRVRVSVRVQARMRVRVRAKGEGEGDRQAIMEG